MVVVAKVDQSAAAIGQPIPKKELACRTKKSKDFAAMSTTLLSTQNAGSRILNNLISQIDQDYFNECYKQSPQGAYIATIAACTTFSRHSKHELEKDCGSKRNLFKISDIVSIKDVDLIAYLRTNYTEKDIRQIPHKDQKLLAKRLLDVDKDDDFDDQVTIDTLSRIDLQQKLRQEIFGNITSACDNVTPSSHKRIDAKKVAGRSLKQPQ